MWRQSCPDGDHLDVGCGPFGADLRRLRSEPAPLGWRSSTLCTQITGPPAPILDPAHTDHRLFGADLRPCAYRSRVLRRCASTLCIQIMGSVTVTMLRGGTDHELFGVCQRSSEADHASGRQRSTWKHLAPRSGERSPSVARRVRGCCGSCLK